MSKVFGSVKKKEPKKNKIKKYCKLVPKAFCRRVLEALTLALGCYLSKTQVLSEKQCNEEAGLTMLLSGTEHPSDSPRPALAASPQTGSAALMECSLLANSVSPKLGAE